MKTTITLNEFSELSPEAVGITFSSTPASSSSQPLGIPGFFRQIAEQQTKRAEKFREMLRRRETTPFASAIPYHRFGINE
jgi:hypothetical protein